MHKDKNCSDAPSGQVLLAIRQFNSTAWFECHETLEALWMQAHGEERDLYQGIIQIAIALHHWRNRNYPGALRLLEGGIGYLSRVPQPCLWIDVAGLIRQAQDAHNVLSGCGQERMAEVVVETLVKIKTTSV
jgi:predicted metal-dependent hydrolase